MLGADFRPYKVIFPIMTALFLTPATAQELVISAPEEIEDALRASSLTRVALAEETTTSQDIVAAAKADYRRFVSALYAKGYYSATVSIEIDGREVSSLSPFETPAQVATISVAVDPGPLFRFGRAEVTPLAPDTELPDEFQSGEPALSGLISQAARAAVQGWRDQGHAKVAVAGQSVTANHTDAELDVTVTLDTGPRLTFGNLEITGNEDVRTERVEAMIGFEPGMQFSDDNLDTIQRRVQRTGAFRFALVKEAEVANPDDTIDILVEVQEEQKRRLGFGGEIGSSDGVSLTAFWFHRNLLGGAERLRFDVALSREIEDNAELEYLVGTSFVKPSVFAPEGDFRTSISISREASESFREDIFEFNIGFDYRLTEDLFTYGGLRLTTTRTDLRPEKRDFLIVGAPFGLVYDNREITTDAREGIYAKAELFPFLGQRDADDGARLTVDARYYRSFAEESLTLAARGQLGSVFNARSGAVPESFLFLSGGGGTVRGQPFESLGVDRNGTVGSGEGFAGLSLEARYRLTDTIGAVGFFDYGFITEGDVFTGSGKSHSGAGLGVRYDTPVGPIRLDIAAPVGGDTDDGVQFYFGLGQSF